MVYWEKADHSWTKDSERVIHTPSQKSKELFFYLQEIGHFKAFKPYFTERENLPSYLIKFTLGGQGFLQYQGKEYHLSLVIFFGLTAKNTNYTKRSVKNHGKWSGFISMVGKVNHSIKNTAKIKAQFFMQLAKQVTILSTESFHC